jgi:uncharacterized membrane protein YeaQ/YmgE (transglycosylase-associated protein family)
LSRGIKLQQHPIYPDSNMTSILGIIAIGFVAGIIARILSPGPNNPSGFVLTTALGVAGAVLATYLGQAIGWYHAGETARFIGATIGALLILFVWNRLVAHRIISDPTLGWRRWL